MAPTLNTVSLLRPFLLLLLVSYFLPSSSAASSQDLCLFLPLSPREQEEPGTLSALRQESREGLCTLVRTTHNTSRNNHNRVVCGEVEATTAPGPPLCGTPDWT